MNEHILLKVLLRLLPTHNETEEHGEHIKHLDRQINKYKSKTSKHKAKLKELKDDHDD